MHAGGGLDCALILRKPGPALAATATLHLTPPWGAAAGATNGGGGSSAGAASSPPPPSCPPPPLPSPPPPPLPPPSCLPSSAALGILVASLVVNVVFVAREATRRATYGDYVSVSAVEAAADSMYTQ